MSDRELVRVVATLDVTVDAQIWTAETGYTPAGPDVKAQVTSVLSSVQTALERMRGTTDVQVEVREDTAAQLPKDPWS